MPMLKTALMACLVLWLGGAVCAEEVAPADLAGRATVAITAKEGSRNYFGTGSIISPLGYVLTSTTTVPPKANEINVVSPGRFKLKGTLVKADEKTELSVVRIDPPDGKPLPFFTIRDSKTAQLGEVVMTVANSFDAVRRSGELSVSLGLLSGRYKLTRALAEQPVFVGEVIETTAATNPGSDGGPLLDGSGQLVGVLSLNVSNARWLGVAVPIEVMLPQLQAAIRDDLTSRKVAIGEEPVKVVASSSTPLFPAWEERAALFREAAAKVAPSVVAIKVERTKEDPRFEQRRPAPTAGPGRLLGELLKRPDAPVTGVIVEPDGWVATSYFNIAGELKSVKVILPDGKELDAKVVGWDQEHDLALLKVEATGLRAVEFRTDASLGTNVCVLGRSPDTKNLTLTAGIVSAVGRRDESMLQFDAKANVGNTGGPLVGLDGKCLGIVCGVTVNSQHGQNSGIAFATWAAVLPKLLEELKTGAKIKRRPYPSLGVVVAPGAVDLPGVLVARVLPNSAAAKADIKPNDSILKINGEEVEGAAQLVNMVKKMKTGDTVRLTIRRRAQEMEIEAVLQESE